MPYNPVEIAFCVATGFLLADDDAMLEEMAADLCIQHQVAEDHVCLINDFAQKMLELIRSMQLTAQDMFCQIQQTDLQAPLFLHLKDVCNETKLITDITIEGADSDDVLNQAELAEAKRQYELADTILTALRPSQDHRQIMFLLDAACDTDSFMEPCYTKKKAQPTIR